MRAASAQIAGYVSIMSDVFLRLIKMLIGPLLFSTLVVGIAHVGDAKSVGRVFGKATCCCTACWRSASCRATTS